MFFLLLFFLHVSITLGCSPQLLVHGCGKQASSPCSLQKRVSADFSVALQSMPGQKRSSWVATSESKELPFLFTCSWVRASLLRQLHLSSLV